MAWCPKKKKRENPLHDDHLLRGEREKRISDEKANRYCKALKVCFWGIYVGETE